MSDPAQMLQAIQNRSQYETEQWGFGNNPNPYAGANLTPQTYNVPNVGGMDAITQMGAPVASNAPGQQVAQANLGPSIAGNINENPNIPAAQPAYVPPAPAPAPAAPAGQWWAIPQQAELGGVGGYDYKFMPTGATPQGYNPNKNNANNPAGSSQPINLQAVRNSPNWDYLQSVYGDRSWEPFNALMGVADQYYGG